MKLIWSFNEQSSYFPGVYEVTDTVDASSSREASNYSPCEDTSHVCMKLKSVHMQIVAAIVLCFSSHRLKVAWT